MAATGKQETPVTHALTHQRNHKPPRSGPYLTPARSFRDECIEHLAGLARIQGLALAVLDLSENPGSAAGSRHDHWLVGEVRHLDTLLFAGVTHLDPSEA